VLDGGVQRAFYGLLEEDLDAFCAFSEGWYLGCWGFADDVFC